MSIFAIGDTHLSLNSDKPMNIFKGWDDYVERLSANWQAVVEPKDTVVVMGDVSWAMSLSGSSKSPNRRAPVRHASTHEHICVPDVSADTVQKRHLSTVPVSSLNTRTW